MNGVVLAMTPQGARIILVSWNYQEALEYCEECSWVDENNNPLKIQERAYSY